MLAPTVALAACDGTQSVLQPAGPAAAAVAQLWWTMLAGAALVFVFVIGIAAIALRADPDRHPRFRGHLFIAAGGVALPIVLLGSLLAYSLFLGTGLTRPAPEGSLTVEVIGRQWWWEVRYMRADGAGPVVSANEIRIPSGQPVEIFLRAADVIHSFWVPRLAGKIDMVPGRINRLLLEADQPGTFRGQCAEYCGGPHALMAFYVVAMPPGEFAAWLEREAAPARPPERPLLARGQTLFLESGCGTCHTVRGTPADGTFGPDLTHLGARRSLGAGIMPLNVGTIAGWIVDSQNLKPGNRMPVFNTFPGEDLRALAAWLESLQ